MLPATEGCLHIRLVWGRILRPCWVTQEASLTTPGPVRESHRPMGEPGGARLACSPLVQASGSLSTAVMAQQHPGYAPRLHLDMCRSSFSLQREDSPLRYFTGSTFSHIQPTHWLRAPNAMAGLYRFFLLISTSWEPSCLVGNFSPSCLAQTVCSINFCRTHFFSFSFQMQNHLCLWWRVLGNIDKKTHTHTMKTICNSPSTVHHC